MGSLFPFSSLSYYSTTPPLIGCFTIIYIIKREKGWDLKNGEKEKVGKGCTWQCKTLENGDEQACRV
jgi:hypothetical protein